MVNTQSNYSIKIVHQVLVNYIQNYKLQDDYLDEGHPWKAIIVHDTLYICSKYHILKGKIPGHLFFLCDMVSPLEIILDCKLIGKCDKKKNIIMLIIKTINTWIVTIR